MKQFPNTMKKNNILSQQQIEILYSWGIEFENDEPGLVDILSKMPRYKKYYDTNGTKHIIQLRIIFGSQSSLLQAEFSYYDLTLGQEKEIYCSQGNNDILNEAFDTFIWALENKIEYEKK